MDTCAAGPVSKKEATHQRIVEAAGRAVRRHGFEGVAVADIMRSVGLTHGGFYAHFDSREAMLAEALAQAGQDSASRIRKRLEQVAPPGRSALRRLIDAYLSDAHLSSPESGCPVAALASEMPRQSAKLRRVGTQRVHGLLELVRKALPAPQRMEDAMPIASAMVGALQLARTLGASAEGKALLAATRAALLATHDAQ